MPNVRFEHPDLVRLKPQYEMIEDCYAGEKQVKYRSDRYLPRPNAADRSPQNLERYRAYLLRSVFYNVTRRTTNGLVGVIFDTPPTVKIPDTLKPVIADASGGGISLEQCAQRATRYSLMEGRAGLFVDYPDAPEEGISKEDADKLHPQITIYGPLDIINWRVEEIGSSDVLTLVVLREYFIVSDDGFEQKKKEQFRVLRLTNGVYSQQIWRPTETATGGMERPWKSFNDITDAKGKSLDRIPFTFIGAENNDAEPDDPPMYDMASLNIAHYRNSADYEELTFLVGQPTPWISGLSEDWVTSVLGGKVELGSRAVIPLPQGGEAGLLQVTESTLPFSAMEHKEKQMVALGAKLVEQKSVERTATEAKIDNEGETSTLANVARNVGSAIVWALQRCMLFVDGTIPADGEIKYDLNTNFGLNDIAPDMLVQLVAAWVAGALGYKELRDRLRLTGLATMTDEEVEAEAKKKQEETDAREAAKVENDAKIAKKYAPAPAKPAASGAQAKTPGRKAK
jgi:hypothetical protein